jgi:hypothetical protein
MYVICQYQNSYLLCNLHKYIYTIYIMVEYVATFSRGIYKLLTLKNPGYLTTLKKVTSKLYGKTCELPIGSFFGILSFHLNSAKKIGRPIFAHLPRYLPCPIFVLSCFTYLTTQKWDVINGGKSFRPFKFFGSTRGRLSEL